MGRLRHWIAARRVERRAVAEYRWAWRRLARLRRHATDSMGEPTNGQDRPP